MYCKLLCTKLDFFKCTVNCVEPDLNGIQTINNRQNNNNKKEVGFVVVGVCGVFEVSSSLSGSNDTN